MLSSRATHRDTFLKQCNQIQKKSFFKLKFNFFFFCVIKSQKSLECKSRTWSRRCIRKKPLKVHKSFSQRGLRQKDDLLRRVIEVLLRSCTSSFYANLFSASKERLRLEKLAQPSCQALDEFFESIDNHLSLTMNPTINLSFCLYCIILVA